MEELSCYYCHYSDPAHLARCTRTGLYFCNGKGDTKDSHIVHFLRKTNHQEISLPPSNPFHSHNFRCYVCGKTNIFDLGFVSKYSDPTTFLVCRSPCLYGQAMVAAGVDTTTFRPMVSNGHIIQDIVGIPTKNPSISIREANAIVSAALDDNQRRSETEDDGLEAKIEYIDKNEYIEVMTSLVELEKNAAIDANRFEKFNNVPITFKDDKTCVLTLNAKSFRSMSTGRKVFLSDGSGLRESWTVFERLPRNKAQLKFSQNSGLSSATRVSVEVVFTSVPFDRQKDALKRFKKEKSISSQLIVDTILGHCENYHMRNRIQPKAQIHELPREHFGELNQSQRRAIERALSRRFTTIQGPPGTGKTTTIAALVYSLVKSDVKPVLVVAHTNVATDFCAEKLTLTGIKVCRVQSMVREEIFPVTNVDIQAADVVVTTVSTSGCMKLRSKFFPFVVFDEGSQCLDPDILIALNHKCHQAVVVGDHKQLGPVLLSPRAIKKNYGVTIMERLLQQRINPITLKEQYRMHPALAEAPSKLFYGGFLESAVTAQDRIIANQFIKWPNPETPILYWNVYSEEEISSDGKSYVNNHEAGCVAALIERMHNSGLSGSQIGIITPYVNQQELLTEILPLKCKFQDDLFFQELEIASVDSFQGREKDFIIFSTVRANQQKDIGFLKDKRRLCVSITRARYGLIVIGNASTFSKNPTWCTLIEEYVKNGVFCEGNPNSFTKSMFERDTQIEGTDSSEEDIFEADV